MGTMHLTTLYPKDVRRAQYPYSNDEFVSLHACIISLCLVFLASKRYIWKKCCLNKVIPLLLYMLLMII